MEDKTEDGQGIKRMLRLDTYVVVFLLTFALGLTAAYRVMHRRSVETTPGPVSVKQAPVQKETAENNPGDDICDGSFPEVKSVYISDPLKRINRVWYAAHVIFFYKNGDWVRVLDQVRKEDDKFIFSTPDGYFEEVGTWKEDDGGLITISIERRRCHMCSLTKDYRKPAFPIVERWGVKGLIIGQTDASYRKYRQIKEEQVFHHLDENEMGWEIRKILSPCEIRHGINPSGEDY
jgi:hypothetical protein